jgi:hypothetical protein
MNHLHGLIGLWDMLKLMAAHFLAVDRRIQDLRLVFDFVDPLTDVPGRALTDAEKTDLKSGINDLKDLCTAMGLEHAEKMLIRANKDLPASGRELDVILSSVQDEINGKFFLYIPAHRVKYHELTTPEAEIFEAKFPRVSAEIAHAGNCYALAEYTASVFHAMRAIEIALKTLALALGVPEVDAAQWGTILNGIEKRLTALKDVPGNTPQKKEDLQFYSETAMEIRMFKDAWRNHVSHGKDVYAEGKALAVLTHTKSFVKKLSERLEEPT